MFGVRKCLLGGQKFVSDTEVQLAVQFFSGMNSSQHSYLHRATQKFADR